MYARRRRQSGLSLLLIMTVVAVGASYMLLRAFNSANTQQIRDQEALLHLTQAKEALISWALQPAGAGLGQLPYPDILDIVHEASPDYNGEQESYCYDTASWVPNNLGVASRCFGRLPWKTLNMAPSTVEQQDPYGSIPWYAVSANLLDPCILSRLNPAILNWTYPASPTYHCGLATQLPHPWLTVRDALGNVLSNRVAFVLIMPRNKLHTQNRYLPLSLPRNYLDAVVVRPGCAAPCVPGTYDNGAFSPGNDFIMGIEQSKVKNDNSTYGDPYVFNDLLIYVTIEELMQAMQKRVLQEARQRLLTFQALAHSGGNRYFPFAANLGDSTGACVAGQRSGFLPLLAGSCGSGEVITGLPTWFTASSWQNFVYYAVAQDCVQGTNQCSGSGANYLTSGSRNNIRALLIATGRPVSNVAGQIPAMLTPPFALSAARNQTGCCSTQLIDYLDSTENANNNTTYDAQGQVLSTIYNDQLMVVAP